LAATMFCEQYALRGLATAPGSLPTARMAGWLSETAFALAVVLLFADNSIECGAFRVPGELLWPADGLGSQRDLFLIGQALAPMPRLNRQLAGPGPAVGPARLGL
jgi:hypothetical protein